MEITLNGYYTLILATAVLLLGRFLVKRIKFLEDFNIPEPVAGGLVAAAIVYTLNWTMGYSFNIQKELQTACMLMFFTSIGNKADFSSTLFMSKQISLCMDVCQIFFFD